ncbi:hypothetical protein IL306_009150 [Fusarium sp. DS 682]|nr:hypothetical protein IL306_009150 [Fusarium sp. DS 682]
MGLQEISFYFAVVKVIASYIASMVAYKGQSIVHKATYRLQPNSRVVVVIGGSFGGTLVAQRLAHSLPSGYRVVLIEKHSHFNYAFAFPRLSVLSGRENNAFISYDNLAAGAPDGIFERICDEAIDITATHVHTAGGISLPYDYVVIATGAAQPPPARLNARVKDDAIEELHGFQQRIAKADRIAVIGAGAVGIELSTEIKEKYPTKSVTLVHSRQQLLPRFGHKLHEHVLPALQNKGIEVRLGERPDFPKDAGQSVQETNLTFSNGETKTFDLVIPCTGLRPRSDLLATYSPKSIASNVGDVAQSGGAKQGRSCMMQADVTSKNIVSLIKKNTANTEYKPQFFEGALTLTLGKDEAIGYVQRGDFEWLKKTKGPDEDLDVGKMKWQLGAK